LTLSRCFAACDEGAVEATLFSYADVAGLDLDGKEQEPADSAQLSLSKSKLSPTI
jgi:hypothetical protein